MGTRQWRSRKASFGCSLVIGAGPPAATGLTNAAMQAMHAVARTKNKGCFLSGPMPPDNSRAGHSTRPGRMLLFNRQPAEWLLRAGLRERGDQPLSLFTRPISETNAPGNHSPLAIYQEAAGRATNTVAPDDPGIFVKERRNGEVVPCHVVPDPISRLG